MHIRFKQNLRAEVISAEGNELATIMGRDRVNGERVATYPDEMRKTVHTFQDPVLVTDNYRIAQLPPTLRETLFSLFQQNKRTFCYDGTVTKTNDLAYPGVWSPSIDTVLFAHAINLVLGEHHPTTAAELGCGSGFLSKHLLGKAELTSMLVNDLNPHAVRCAQDNITDARAEYAVGDGISHLRGRKYDMIICNPPYIPRPNSIDDNPYEGVSLLHYLLHHGQDHLTKNGVLMVNISNLCESIVLDGKLRMPITDVATMTVPLKVNNVLNNGEWMHYLTTKRGLAREYHNGYEYWQTLKIVKLTK